MSRRYGTVGEYMLERYARARAERRLYALQEACGGHGQNGVDAYETMMRPNVDKIVRELQEQFTGFRTEGPNRERA